jgi:hypothetical protein
MTTQKQRAHMASSMDLLVRFKGRVHYRQVRPMSTMTIRTGHLRAALLRRGGITMDCSESVTLICHLAGLRDPNGLNYDGSGFTGTLLNHLHHYDDPKAAGIGAMVVFGGGTGEHVAMVRRPHETNPLMFSHGTEEDPTYYTLAQLLPAFPGQPHTFLSIDPLGFG